MGAKIVNFLKQPMVRAVLAIAVLALVGGAAWGAYQTQRLPQQPIEFRHNLHIGLGVQCLYCHPGAWQGQSAGLPTQSKCWGCHQQIDRQTPELDKLAQYVEDGVSIPWVPVALMPDFVYFSHRPHIAAGVNCETCHGDLSKMTVAEPQKGMDMGWCLKCHKELAPEKETKLIDCATCHQ
ncbi:MAG: cytochrome c3 family protein [Chloroflexi bacterium]|nr:cytochrome c3 family protein [Chloroflexota bacterium]